MVRREERVMASLKILARNGVDCEKQAAISAISRIKSKTRKEPLKGKKNCNLVHIKYCDSNHKEIILNCILKVAPESNLREVIGRKIIVVKLPGKEAESARNLCEYYWSAFQKETSRLLVAFIIKNDLVAEYSLSEPHQDDLINISEIAQYHDVVQPAVKKLME